MSPHFNKINSNLLGHFCPTFVQKQLQPSYAPTLLHRTKANLGYASLIFPFLLSIFHDDEHPYPEALDSIEKMFPALHEVDT